MDYKMAPPQQRDPAPERSLVRDAITAQENLIGETHMLVSRLEERLTLVLDAGPGLASATPSNKPSDPVMVVARLEDVVSRTQAANARLATLLERIHV